MVLGIGLDIVNIQRIKNSLEKFQSKFENRVFTPKEIARSNKFSNIDLKSHYYSKRFAAKEAFSKATGFGIGQVVKFTDIEVNNDKNGKPYIILSEHSENLLKKHFQTSDFQIDLSMSDEKEISQAIVIISKC